MSKVARKARCEHKLGTYGALSSIPRPRAKRDPATLMLEKVRTLPKVERIIELQATYFV